MTSPGLNHRARRGPVPQWPAVLLLAAGGLILGCGDEPVSHPFAGMAAGAGGAGSTALAGAAAGVAAGTPGAAAGTAAAGVTAAGTPGAAGTTAGTQAAAAGTGSGGVQAGTMSAAGSASAGTAAAGQSAAPEETIATLFWLDINGNRVLRSDERDFSDGEVIVSRTNTAPDGVAVDVADGKVYWSNMGSLLGTGGGTLQRANLDGSNVETLVRSGITRTPKQIQIDVQNRHVYWCDREGAKVWRVSFDGGEPEVLVSGHGFEELVGIALDVERRQFYFTDRIGRTIQRASFDLPAGQTDADRQDIEELFRFSAGAMPIDLDVDLEGRLLYWTDRRLGSVHRAGMDLPAGQLPDSRGDVETLVTGLRDTIGISLDLDNGKMYYSELGGDIWQANLDGSGATQVASSGSATGVALAHLPLP